VEEEEAESVAPEPEVSLSLSFLSNKLPNILPLFDSFLPLGAVAAAVVAGDGGRLLSWRGGSDKRRGKLVSLRSMSTEARDVRDADESLSSPLPAALEVSLCEALGQYEQQMGYTGLESSVEQKLTQRTSPLRRYVLRLECDFHGCQLPQLDHYDRYPFR
jgi:hypothetical protein